MTYQVADPVAGRLRGWRRLGMSGRLLGMLACLSGCAANQPDNAPEGEADLSPLVLIESPDSGDAFFTRIGNIVVTPDSLVIVESGGTGQFLIFGPSGQLLRTIGRRGTGPGEFQAPASFGLRHDSLWVFDYITRRITTFSPSTGRVAGSVTPSGRIPGWHGPIQVVALLEDGGILIQGHRRLGDETGSTSVPFGIESSSGRFTPLGTLETAGTSFRTAQRNGSSIVGLQPFVARPRLVATAMGGRFALVEPADTGVSIAMFSADGGVRYRTHLMIPGEELTRTTADSILARMGPQLASVEEGIIQRPRRLPAVSAAIADNAGSLWLRLDLPELNRSTSQWLIVDPDGTPTDTVHVPREHHVVRPDAFTYWAWTVDSLDVPTLGRYAWQPKPR